MFQANMFQHDQERRILCWSVICKTALVWSASMDPLAVVEAQLGSVDSWSEYKLTRMFILKPYPRLVKHVAAFMYGNNVKLMPWPVITLVMVVIREVLKPRWGRGTIRGIYKWIEDRTVLQYATDMFCLDKWEGSRAVWSSEARYYIQWIRTGWTDYKWLIRRKIESIRSSSVE